MQVGSLQVDNQLALTPMPVIMALEEAAHGVRPECVLKVTLSMQAPADQVQTYPYVGVQVRSKMMSTRSPLGSKCDCS